MLLDLKSNKIFDQRWRNISPAFPIHNHISNSRLQPIRSSPVSLNIIIKPEVDFTYFLGMYLYHIFSDLRVSGMFLCSPRLGWRRHSGPRPQSTAPSLAWAGTMTSLPGDNLLCCLVVSHHYYLSLQVLQQPDGPVCLESHHISVSPEPGQERQGRHHLRVHHGHGLEVRTSSYL